eukprot:SAG31_NODE_362_length_16904_cov_7.893218_16_plen_130_part_00
MSLQKRACSIHPDDSSVLGCVGRDLKSANVLVTEGLRCKVADFGMSRVLASGGRGSGADGRRTLQKNLTMKFNFGGWIAPEVITGRAYDSAVDVWAFGVLLCELVTVCSAAHRPQCCGRTENRQLSRYV